MQESVHLKSFELFVQDIAGVDVGLLHALSLSVGWSHRPKAVSYTHLTLPTILLV